ncbi:MAG: CIA30 family protein [Planctomycetes bacterium]|nr:CIA30 family protein [Planctomycetota bacterium]
MKQFSCPANRFLVYLVVSAAASFLHAADAAPGFPSWSFKSGPEGWKAPFGGDLSVKGGELAYKYDIQVGAFAAFAVENLKLSDQVKALHLRVKSSHAEGLAVILKEQDRSNYKHEIPLKPGKWSELDIPISAFYLDTKALGEDAVDENQKLDLTQVESFFVVDASGLVLGLLGGKAGERAVLNAEIRVAGVAFRGPSGRAGAPAPARSGSPGKGRSGPSWTFRADVEGWTAVFGGDVSEERGELAYRYDITAWQLRAVMVENPPIPDTAQQIRLRLRSSHTDKLTLALEEADGSSYVTEVALTPGQWKDVDVPLSSFHLNPDAKDDHGKDENDRLDLSQVRYLQVVDLAGLVHGLLGSKPGEVKVRDARLTLDDVSFR